MFCSGRRIGQRCGLALPGVALEPCETIGAWVSSTALVRYRGNNYSVPTAHGFQPVLVKGFVETVVI